MKKEIRHIEHDTERKITCKKYILYSIGKKCKQNLFG